MEPIASFLDVMDVCRVLDQRQDLLDELLETGSVTVRFDNDDLVIALYGEFVK